MYVFFLFFSFFFFLFLWLLKCCAAVWSLQRNRRKLFERYAKEHHFDPLVPDNWYHQSRASLLSFKVLIILSFISFVSFFNIICLFREFVELLFIMGTVYPKLWLSSFLIFLWKKKSWKCIRVYYFYFYYLVYDCLFIFSKTANWQESKTRRLFLEKVAKKRGLDPLNPAHWYSIKSDDLIQIKVFIIIFTNSLLLFY